MTILPRIYSNDPSHIDIYRKWTGLSVGEKPRFKDNLSFMLKYQLGHMYGRYFMWNFAGRVSDTQNSAEGVQINLEKSYDNLVRHADYANLSNPKVYFNHEDYQARMITSLKFNFNSLINSYAVKGDMERAGELSLFVYENLYFDHLEPSYADLQEPVFWILFSAPLLQNGLYAEI